MSFLLSCCCFKNRPTVSDQSPVLMPASKPIVTLFGSTGYVGKFITPAFLDALEDGRIKEVRLATRKVQGNETIQELVGQRGVKSVQVDFSDADSLSSILVGSDAVVSFLGTGPGFEEINKQLVDAIVAVGDIKSFFPSEFGTNHYRIKSEFDDPLFVGKKAIFRYTKATGLNTIRILPGDILEASFGPWFGLDNAKEVWTIVGDGKVPVAMTAEKDLANYTLEAVLQSVIPGNLLPDMLEIYSVQQTLTEYAEIFDKVARRPTKLEFVTLESAKAEYKSCPTFEKILQILFNEGAYDYTKSKDNEILNPGQKCWKLKTIEEYAQETGGRPWNTWKPEALKSPSTLL